MMGPGGGGGGDGQGGGQGGALFARFIISSITTLIMSGLMILLYSFAPHHEPNLRSEGPSRPPVQNGVWEKNDFFGLVDTQWTLRDGVAEGDALQFHSNGSLFREMTYRRGRLDGTVREYHEKDRYRRPPVRGRLAGTAERLASAGTLRRTLRYQDGTPEGPYAVYYPDGILKEEGVHRAGKKQVLAMYRKDGRPRGSAAQKNTDDKEDLWTLGR